MNEGSRVPSARPFPGGTAPFGGKEETPRAFLERCLENIATWEPSVGAFVCTDIAAARAAADASTTRWNSGRPLSAIDGMPVGVKDIIETADMPTEMGSPLFAGWRSGWDAAAVAALREAGAVIVGKTVTTEFAATEPRGTRNPHDLARTPGGSSSGSAAAVSAGMISAGLGTQVIGSIVRPASYCGCIGFKPSLGAVNRGGSHDYFSQSCTGVLAATLANGWQLAIEIASRVGGDPGYPPLAGPVNIPSPKTPQRLALLETSGWTAASDDAKAALHEAVARLRREGIEVMTRRSHPEIEAVERAIADTFALSTRINDWECRWPLNMFHAHGHEKLSHVMRDRFLRGQAMQPDEYRAALAERVHVRAIYAKLADICDGCITLAAPGSAPVGLHSTGDPAFAVPFSLLGVPAISLPLLQEQNLPLGLQLTGFANADAAAIATAGWLVATLERSSSR